MDDKNLLEKLEKAKLAGFKLDANKEALKVSVLNTVAAEKTVKKQWLNFRFVPVMTALAAVVAIAVYTVDNFDDGDRFNRNGGVWSTYSDSVAGGDSVIWPAIPEEDPGGFTMSSPGYGGKGYAVRVTGGAGIKIGLNYNYAGVVARFSPESSCPQCQGADIKKYTGIKFKVKGSIASGRVYFVLPYEDTLCEPERMTCGSLTDYADYEADITKFLGDEWTTVMLDFKNDLKQPDWTPDRSRVKIDNVLETVHLFKWQFKYCSGPFELWIDDIELY
ncbi:MAG: hypothetical protein LLG37_01580 [Spirochaetia bacterium]|nr:hypothetical protein [Spirochaetia bacterium]